MSKNNNLNNAKRAKNDEFYTQLKDIENELQYYKKQLAGKIVYCNCDDPERSNFYRYFYDNYSALGLAGLIASCHSSEKNGTAKAIWAEYDGEIETVKEFYGDGDFRSDESIELLKRADIVVTNPPFSLFREYIAQLMDYEKQFIILGDINALTYKEIFPFLMRGEVHMGKGKKRKTIEFRVDEKYYNEENKDYRKDDKGIVWKELRSTNWYSNVKIEVKYEDIDLVKKYTPEAYPKYDNYDAINVDKVIDIPYDYDGVMGVPITIMDKYSPEQFEIVGLLPGPKIGDRNVYKRFLVKNKRRF